jgi:oligoribonuclease
MTEENEQRATASSSKLIWIDLEMTGLDTIADHIIEIATIVTDAQLIEVAVGPVVAIQQSLETMDAMDDWNTRHHGDSGLTARVLASTTSMQEAESETIDFLRKHVAEGASPMCGNSICQDRRFMAREMPALESYFHYRNLDVSTLKILAQHWAPGVAAGFNKESEHRALADIRDSIAELAYYRDALFDQSIISKEA